jgi:hypothetical protein
MTYPNTLVLKQIQNSNVTTLTKLMIFDGHIEIYEEDWENGDDVCQRHLGEVDITAIAIEVAKIMGENS